MPRRTIFSKIPVHTIVNQRLRSPIGLPVRAVRDWMGELRCLQSSVWSNKSISILTHGVRQSTMSWDGRSLNFAILREEALAFVDVADCDLYDKVRRSDRMEKAEADECRRELVQDIHHRGGDVPARTGWLFADVASDINESIVNIEGGIHSIQAIGFRTYASPPDQHLRHRVAHMCNLMDGMIATTLARKLGAEIPLIQLNHDTGLFSELTLTPADIKALQENIRGVEVHPAFQKIVQNGRDGDRPLYRRFQELRQSVDEVCGGYVPFRLRLSYAVHQVRSTLFAQPSAINLETSHPDFCYTPPESPTPTDLSHSP